MTRINRQITLASRPAGFPKVSDFHLVYSALPAPAPGEVLLQVVYLSLDPGRRGRMSTDNAEDRALGLGEVMAGGAVALVLESHDANFTAGDAVEGMLGWQEYAVVPGRDLRKIDPSIAPISTALGVLGMPGLTALFGLMEICHPQRGETVVVSGAAGAVGMLVGQIAKIQGCRVVGIEDSASRISWLVQELGFDAVLNSRTTVDLDAELAELCPDGIDIYFDNAGGTTSDAALRRINALARISVCGQSSQDNLEKLELGPRWLGQLALKQAKAQGFRIPKYTQKFSEGRAQLAHWLREGKLQYREEVAQGIEAAPQAFIAMLQGNSQGKQLVRLSAS